MPLRLDVKRTLTTRSDRAKSVDIHPSEPWLLVCLYNGSAHIWNTESQTLIKTFEVCELPVRCGKFVARKNWVVTGSDDLTITVFNYNTLEKVHGFEAHTDYIRCLQVHPSQPFLLSSSDDMTIKLWNWDKKWEWIQSFEGHNHYVMQIVINPKDNNQFASASLDRTIKVWQLGSSQPNFTLEGHTKGVNSVDYFHGGDKPYLVSGADDRLVKLWDYQTKSCVQTLEGHAQNVTSVLFHPQLPILLSGSEDGTVRVWHTNTHRLESTLNYGMQRAWAMAVIKGTNDVAIGYDEGTVLVKLGREEPAMSMDSSGKIIFAKHSDILQANLKNLNPDEIKDGEVLPLAVKEMGPCEIYPQNVVHNPNGRFVVVCGDGEYIIYTAMALRNKSFGSAHEFVWASDSSEYAIRDNTKVKMFKNFKEKKEFKLDASAEGIYGGSLLGVKSTNGLAFYDWDTQELIRRIDIEPKNVIWSETGEMFCITTEESFFVLKYVQESVAAALENREELVTEDGIEDAFQVLGEFEEVVKTGLWVGDCFIFTTSVNRLNYYVGGEIVTICHLTKPMYLLGYIPKDDRLYLSDKELNVVSYHLLLSVLEYQTAVMRKDFETAQQVLPTIPKEQRNRVAHFLDKQGFKQQALHVSCDLEHQFELAIQLADLTTAYDIALKSDSEEKWKHLAELAIQKCEFALAQECLHKAQDFAGLLLLASCSGDALMMEKLALDAEKEGKFNVSFIAYFSLGRLEECLELLCKSNRLPEAAFLARTYLPSEVPRIVALWKEELGKTNRKAADSLADPTQYSNLFPHMQEAITAEEFLKADRLNLVPASLYATLPNNLTRDAFDEVHQAQLDGTYQDVVSLSQPNPIQESSTIDTSTAAGSGTLTPVPVAVEAVDEVPLISTATEADSNHLVSAEANSPASTKEEPESLISEATVPRSVATEVIDPAPVPEIEDSAKNAEVETETKAELLIPAATETFAGNEVLSSVEAGVKALSLVEEPSQQIDTPESVAVQAVDSLNVAELNDTVPSLPTDNLISMEPTEILEPASPIEASSAVKPAPLTALSDLADLSVSVQPTAPVNSPMPIENLSPAEPSDLVLENVTAQIEELPPLASNLSTSNLVSLESATPIDNQVPIGSVETVDNFVPTDTANPSDILVPENLTAPNDFLLPVKSTTSIEDLVPVKSSALVDNLLPLESTTSIDNLVPIETAASIDNLLPIETAAPIDNLLPLQSTPSADNPLPANPDTPFESLPPAKSTTQNDSPFPTESTETVTDNTVPVELGEPVDHVPSVDSVAPVERSTSVVVVEPVEVKEEGEEDDDISDLDDLDDWDGDFDVDDLELDDDDDLDNL